MNLASMKSLSLHRYALLFPLLGVLVAGCRKPTFVEHEPALVSPGTFIKTWSTVIDFKKINGAYLDQDLLTIYGPGNVVAGYDTAGGLQFRTQVAPEKDIIRAPIVQGDRVIFPASSSLRIVTRNGIVRNPIELPQPIRSGAVATGNTAFVGIDSEQGGRIASVALDRELNPINWTGLAGGVVNTRPALYENVVYSATEDGQVIALNSDRTLLWPRSPEGAMPNSIFKTDGKITAPLKVDEGGVYVPSHDGKLYALDPTTGRIRWEYIVGVAVKHSAQPSTDTVYIYIQGKGMVALDKKTPPRYQKERWINRDAVLVAADDAQYTYVLTRDGHIAALDKQTGVQAYATERNDFVHVMPHLASKDNTIYAITSDNQLMAITPVNRAGVVGRLVMAD